MACLAKRVAIFLLLTAISMAQQPTNKPHARIICTPPNLQIVRMVRPTFPQNTKARNMFGMVTVEVEIDKHGQPSKIDVLEGDALLAAAVVKAVKKWKWKPLKLNGEAVEVTTKISVNFEPR